MAYTTANTAADRSGNPLMTAFAAVGNWLISIAESSDRARRVEQLNSLTDAQLAELGLKRQDIVRHVFRDLYYV